MQTDDFIEISAVVTHPEYTRKGFAKQLDSSYNSTNFKRKKTPYIAHQ